MPLRSPGLEIGCVIVCLCVVAGVRCAVAAPAVGTSCPGGRIANFHLGEAEGRAKPLSVQVAGAECQIAGNALKAWILRGGRRIVYSVPGSGGFESEGQALVSYEAASGRRRTLLSESFAIDSVEEFRTSGTRARQGLLVTMHDGGLGASHVAVVDLDRGEVFLQQQAKVLRRRGDRLELAYFRDEDWEQMAQGGTPAPLRTRTFNLAALVKGKLIKRGE